MPKIIVLLIMLFGMKSYSSEGFHCVPSLKQTRVQVLVKEGQIELLVINPMGYDFMPQFDLNRSSYLLKYDQMQADDLRNLGDVFTFKWPKSACKVDSNNFIVNCTGEAKGAVQDIKSYGLSTTEITEKNRDSIYEKRRFRLNVEKDNIYFINLEFLTSSCAAFN